MRQKLSTIVAPRRGREKNFEKTTAPQRSERCDCIKYSVIFCGVVAPLSFFVVFRRFTVLWFYLALFVVTPLPLYMVGFCRPFLFIYNKKSLLAYNSIIPNTT